MIEDMMEGEDKIAFVFNCFVCHSASSRRK